MEENFKNKLGFWTFFLLVIFLLVGGYFFTNYIIMKEENGNKESNVKIPDYKIDKKEDYIYFINSEVISEDAEIYYQDVVINLSTQTALTEILEKENNIYKDNIKYLSDVELLTDEIINYKNDNLYALTFREYETYEYNNYVSLVINDFNYSCFDEKTFNKTKSYVFDLTTGEVLEEENLLELYNTNMNKIKEMIKTHLESNQEIVDEVELIKIDETINELNKYSLYINDYGKLYISFLVKTNQVDYNEIMEVN